jgi:hypothetical protein
MKLIDYLIREAYAKRDWQGAARLVCGDPHLSVEDSRIKIYRDINNIAEVIVDHGGIRRRWSSVETGVTTEEDFQVLGSPTIIIFAT